MNDRYLKYILIGMVLNTIACAVVMTFLIHSLMTTPF
jgi:hypothetical protein